MIQSLCEDYKNLDEKIKTLKVNNEQLAVCSYNVIKCLIEKGFKFHDRTRCSFLLKAIQMKYDKVVSYLFSQLAISNELLRYALHSYNKNPQIFNANVEIDGQLWLHHSILNNNNELALFLIHKGANILQKNSEDQTPLYLAHSKEMDDVTWMLFYYGANYEDINNGEQKAVTILEFASNVFKTVPFKGTNNRKETLWHYAAENEVFYISSLFCATQIDNQDNDGNTALHLAVKRNNKKLIECFLQRGASSHIFNEAGKTAQMLASKESVAKLFETINGYFIKAKTRDFSFLDNFADSLRTLYKDKDGKTFMHYAVLGDNFEAVCKFTSVTSYKDLSTIYEIEDNDGKTPLFYAANNNNWKIVKYLLEKQEFKFNYFVNMEKNDCTEFLLRLEKCINFADEDDIENLKEEMKGFKSPEQLTLAVVARKQFTCSIQKLARTNYGFFLYLLKNGAVLPKYLFEYDESHNFDLNKRISKLYYLLDILPRYIVTKKLDPNSLFRYYTKALKDIFAPYFSKTRENVEDVAHEILINVRFGDGGKTLLHIAATPKNKDFIEYLLKEKNVDPHVKDFDNLDVFERAKQGNLEMVLDVLQKIKTENKKNSAMKSTDAVSLQNLKDDNVEITQRGKAEISVVSQLTTNTENKGSAMSKVPATAKQTKRGNNTSTEASSSKRARRL